jgi:Nuclear transport factor 2 (NTF2) domain
MLLTNPHLQLAKNDINPLAALTIQQYFTTLNDGEYSATAALFAEAGWLKPPFEAPIQGRAAIAQYLGNEAPGMAFQPEATERLLEDDQLIHYQIQGKVQTPWFIVNVAWLIELNSNYQIMSVEVKLLDALNTLLGLNHRHLSPN